MAGSPLLQFEHHRRGYAKHYLEDAFDMAVGLSSRFGKVVSLEIQL
jgi:hypothetical protein